METPVGDGNQYKDVENLNGGGQDEEPLVHSEQIKVKVGGNRIKKNGNEHPDTEKEGRTLGFHATFSGIFDDGQAPEEAEEAPSVKVGTNV